VTTRPTRRYRVRYSDGPGEPVFTWGTYAYSEEHARENFYDSSDSDGWEIVSVDRPSTPWGKVDTKYDRAAGGAQS
jgi:hypothetical protein